MKPQYLFSISCRFVGPGGTSVAFYATADGVKCIWTNENCPYDCICEDIDEETNEAADGHNVDYLSWGDMKKLVNLYENRPPPHEEKDGLNPQPKRVLNKRKGKRHG